MKPKITPKIIANLRTLCADMVEQAQSGHPGSALSLTPVLLQLFIDLNNHPDNNFKDLFIMSNAHVCPILFVLNYLLNNLTIKDLKEFRKINSKTPGHPEKNSFIPLTSEPLGQGVAQSVGIALALIKQNRKVLCVFGDGCYQEGISQEAFSLAAHHKLSNLIYLYDYNQMTIDGPTCISMTEEPKKRFEALNYNVIEITSYEEITNFEDKLSNSNPTIFIYHSKIGQGCSLEGENDTHGLPLGKKVISEMKNEFGLKDEPFFVSEELLQFKEDFLNYKSLQMKECNSNTSIDSFNGNSLNGNSLNSKPLNGKSLECNYLSTTFIDSFNKSIAEFYSQMAADSDDLQESVSSRKYFACTIRKMVNLPNIFYGAADLAQSLLIKVLDNKANLIHKLRTPSYIYGNYIDFGVREHAMCAIFNGLASQGYLCIGGTFLNFVTYCFPAIRSACLDNLKNIYIFTHDSVLVGKDGPTHQPTEALALLRNTINLKVIRPCSEIETKFALAYSLINCPAAIIFTRQPINYTPNTSFNGCEKGGYFLINQSNPKLTLISCGSEISLCLEVTEYLNSKNIHVNLVSMVCRELFDEQGEEYKSKLLCVKPVVAVELSSDQSWYKYADVFIGMTTYGKSGAENDLKEYFGFTKEKIGEKLIALIN